MGFRRGTGSGDDEKSGAMVFLDANLRIRLTDQERRPVPGGRCRMLGRQSEVYTCDADGIVEIPLEDRSRKIIDLEWEAAGGSGAFPWSNSFEVGVSSDEDADCGIRLTHLGFPGEELTGQVSDYQEFFGKKPTGRLDDIREELIKWHGGGGSPKAGPAPATKPAAPTGEVKNLVEKLYLAFNDSGFIGLGGTDEEGVLGTLRSARDKGLMREVDSQYRASYPEEPGLKEELDDELSGDDYATAMQIYNEGMQAPSKPQASAGGGSGPAGASGSLHGTLVPGVLASVRIQVLNHELKPMPQAACRLAGDPDRIFTADGEGMVELPVHEGVSCVEIEWEDEDAAPDDGPDLPRFYYKRAVALKETGKAEG